MTPEFFAVADPQTMRVLEVATNEAASLEGMQAYAQQGISPVRFPVSANAFARYSTGETLTYDLEVEGGRITRRVLKGDER